MGERPESSRRLLAAIGGMSGISVISRMTGWLRDAVCLAAFGAGAVSDAYLVAIRIPNMLRTILGEGGLPGALIPTFSKVEKEAPERLPRVVVQSAQLLLAIASLSAALGVLISPWLVDLFASGFHEVPGKWELTVRLNRVVFAYVVLISLTAFCQSLLNFRDRFLIPSTTPIALNLTIVGVGSALGHLLGDAALGFVLAWLVGGVFQLTIVAIPIAKERFPFFRLDLSPIDAAVISAGLLLLPRIAALGVVQVNLIVGSRIAAGLGDAKVTWLFVAYRVLEIASGAFVVSVATVMLPRFSRFVAASDETGLLASLNGALRSIIFVTVPAAVGLFTLRQPIIAALYGHGRFDEHAVAATADALGFFTIGLVFIAMNRIMIPVFYALHDTKTPVLTASLDVATFVTAASFLSGSMDHLGLALATSLSAMVHCCALILLLRRKISSWAPLDLGPSLARAGLGATLMGGAVASFHQRWPSGGLLLEVTGLALAVGLGVGVFAVTSRALRAPELAEFAAMIRRKPRPEPAPKNRAEPEVEAEETR